GEHDAPAMNAQLGELATLLTRLAVVLARAEELVVGLGPRTGLGAGSEHGGEVCGEGQQIDGVGPRLPRPLGLVEATDPALMLKAAHASVAGGQHLETKLVTVELDLHVGGLLLIAEAHEKRLEYL